MPGHIRSNTPSRRQDRARSVESLRGRLERMGNAAERLGLPMTAHLVRTAGLAAIEENTRPGA